MQLIPIKVLNGGIYKKMNNIRLKILSPWVIYCRKLEALFDGDP